MNQYFTMLKKNVIDFDKLLLLNYKKLNIDEVDCIILIKLNSFLTNGEHFLLEGKIAEEMTIDVNSCSNRILELIHKEFIYLTPSENSYNDVFNLDGAIKKLSFILDEKDILEDKTVDSNKINDTIALLEKKLNKSLSSIDREIVTKWFIDYKYDYEMIESVVVDEIKNRNANVIYIDRVLFNKTRKREEEINDLSDERDINEVFEKVINQSKKKN